MSNWAPIEYKTTNWSADNEALRQRGSLTIWFDPDLPDDDGLLRHAHTAADKVPAEPSAPGRVGLDSAEFQHPVPPPTKFVSIPYRGGKGPLNLLIPSQASLRDTLPGNGQHRHQGREGEGGWHARKHGSPKRRIWRKIQIGIYEETPGIRALEVTSYTALGVPFTQPVE